MPVHAKKINLNGSSNMVSFTGSIAATDTQIIESDGTTIYQPEFRTIEEVNNFSGGNVTFGGYTFAAGSWKFSERGGLKMATAQSGAITGNARCLITLRT